MAARTLVLCVALSLLVAHDEAQLAPSASATALPSESTSATPSPSVVDFLDVSEISSTPAVSPSQTPSNTINWTPTFSPTATFTATASASNTINWTPTITPSSSPGQSDPPPVFLTPTPDPPLPASLPDLFSATELDGATNNFNILANLMQQSGLGDEILAVNSGHMTLHLPTDAAFMRAARSISDESTGNTNLAFTMRQAAPDGEITEETAMKIFSAFAQQERIIDGTRVEGRMVLRSLLAYHICGGQSPNYSTFTKPLVLVTALNMPLYIAHIKELVDLSDETSNAGIEKEAFITSEFFTVHAMNNVLFPFPMSAPTC